MATRKRSKSTAIGSASDVGRPYRNPKAYKPATKLQQRVLTAAALTAIPGGRVLGAAAKAAKAGKSVARPTARQSNVKVVSSKRGTTAQIRERTKPKNFQSSGPAAVPGKQSKVASNPRTAARINAERRRLATNESTKRNAQGRLNKYSVKGGARGTETQRIYTGPNPKGSPSKKAKPGRNAGKSPANMMAKEGVKSGQLPRGYTSSSVSPRRTSVPKKYR